MKKIIIKAIIFGFLTGILFLLVAPLGLGIYFIEILKPILIPGINLFRPVFDNTSGYLRWVVAFILNGLVYTIFFLIVSLIKTYLVNNKST
jgi:hypothetical protein